MKHLILTCVCFLSIAGVSSPTRSNTSARHSAYVSSASPSLINVEYLESTGGQYILLPPIPSMARVAFSIGWYMNRNTSVYLVIFGMKKATDRGTYVQFLPSYAIFDLARGRGVNRIISSSRPALDSWHHAEFLDGTLYIDDVQCSPTISDVYNPGGNTFSFLGVFGAWNENSHTGNEVINGRIAYFKLWYDGELAHSLVPVRMGKEGFMLDEVDGTLYGNCGMGSFVIGPDL